MPKPIAQGYIKETIIPEYGNPVCKYWKLMEDGKRIEITQAGFGQARKAGKPWTQEITITGGNWVADQVRESSERVVLTLIPMIRNEDWSQERVVYPVQAPQEPQEAPKPEPEAQAPAPAPEPQEEPQAPEKGPEWTPARRAPKNVRRIVIDLAAAKMEEPPAPAPAPVKIRKTCSRCKKFRVTIDGLCQFCRKEA